jgi:deltex-like protein
MSVQWYFYLQHDPRGQPDGWYPYDPALTDIVEQLWVQSNGSSSNAMLPSTASSGFQYSVDFTRMVQRNLTSGKERPIGRTTTGLPPPLVPGAAAAMAPVVPAAAAPVPSAPQAYFSFGFGSRRNQASNTAPSISTRYSCTLHYHAPESLHEVQVDDSRVFQNVTAPPSGNQTNKFGEEKKSGSFHDADDDCAICMESLWTNNQSGSRVVSIKTCQHCFHYDCIHEALSMGCGGKCPMCFTPIDTHQDGTRLTSKGKCPSATMTITSRPGESCAGYENHDLLLLSYHIPSGMQKKYHPAPNLPFTGAERAAYLPNNAEGQDLLVRMQYAFMHGLCFMVGTSLTTGQANVVTWASIHHKTSPCGGTYGFPDASYFSRSNDEMDDLGIPDPASCRAWLLSKCPGYI